MLRFKAIFPASLQALASLLETDAGSTAHAFKLPGRLRHLPVTSRPSIGQITHVVQSAVMLKAFPKRFDAASRSLRGTMVTCVT